MGVFSKKKQDKYEEDFDEEEDEEDFDEEEEKPKKKKEPSTLSKEEILGLIQYHQLRAYELLDYYKKLP